MYVWVFNPAVLIFKHKSGYIDIRKRIFVFEDYFVFLFHSFMGSTVNKTKLVQWNLRNFFKCEEGKPHFEKIKES